jgi:hypothetical protein
VQAVLARARAESRQVRTWAVLGLGLAIGAFALEAKPEVLAGRLLHSPAEILWKIQCAELDEQGPKIPWATL